MPGTLPGERIVVEARLDARGRRWGILREVLEPHPERVDPECAHHARCRGCPLRQASEAFAGPFKVALARRAYERITGRAAPPGELLSPVSRDGFRARLSATRIGDILGMAALPDEAPIDLRVCPAQTAGVRGALAALQADLEAAGLMEDVTRVSVTCMAAVRGGGVHAPDATAPGDVRVLLAAASSESLLRLRAARFPDRPGRAVFAKVPARDGDLEREAHLLIGEPTMRFEFDGDVFQATLPAWLPQSPGTLSALRDWVVRHLEPDGARVLELGCGVGTLSLSLSRRARELVGVDCVRAATLDAAKNAELAGCDRAAFRVGFADHACRRLLSRGDRFDAVLLHGMRAPFGSRLMDTLPASGAARLAYLAPVTASLARDLTALRGYSLTRLDFLDQMPGTAHVLAMGALQRI